MAKKKGKYKRIVQHGNIKPDPVSSGTHGLIITQTQRGGLDVNDYIEALDEAENVDYPNRSKLNDINEESMTDAHLHAVRQKRTAMILSSPIEFTRDGVIDEKIGEQIRSPWFQNLCIDIVEAEEHGNNLVQLRRDGDWLNYDKIPHKHYDPVRRIIKTRQTDIEGIPFEEFSDMLLIGNPRDLGLLTKASLYVIYKRNAMSDFAAFIEKFGRPFIEGEYDGFDEKIRKKLLRDLYVHSGGSVLVRPSGSKINLHDVASKGATSDLHKTFVTLCNEEISKLYLGSTLTVEVGDKGTQALGTVHQAGQEQLGRLSKQRLLNVLNYELTDIFSNLGLDTRGGEFTFSVPQNKDLSARIQIDQMLYSMRVPFPESYFHETYGVPAPGVDDKIISKEDPVPQLTKPPQPPSHPEPVAEPEPIDQAQESLKHKKAQSLKNRIIGYFRGNIQSTDFKARMSVLYRPAATSSDAEFLFNREVLKAALERIYKGDLNPKTEIEENLFNEFYGIFNQATDMAFPGIKPGDVDFEFYEQIRVGNAKFAAFKTHKMQNELADQMLDDNGTLKTFHEWRKDVTSIVDHHVDHWLQTEYDTFINRTHLAAEWQQIEREKHILPNVRWVESTSATPRESHRQFWGRVFSIGDPILEEHRPGNEWGCKCGLSATDDPVTDNKDLPGGGSGHSPGLGGNPGETGEIFSEDHPYIANAHKGAAKAVKQYLKTLEENE